MFVDAVLIIRSMLLAPHVSLGRESRLMGNRILSVGAVTMRKVVMTCWMSGLVETMNIASRDCQPAVLSVTVTRQFANMEVDIFARDVCHFMIPLVIVNSVVEARLQ